MNYKLLTAFRKKAFNIKNDFFKGVIVFLVCSSSLQAQVASTQGFSKTAKKEITRNSARIAFTVNGDVITHKEIDDRVHFVCATSGVANAPDVLKTMKEQIIKSLIDEKIQLQAAALQKVIVTDNEIKAAFSSIAHDNQMTSEQMLVMFKEKEINIQTLFDRLKAQIAWSKTIQDAFGSTVQISEKEVQNYLNKLRDNCNKDQYELREIFFKIEDSSQEGEVFKNVYKVYEQLKQGAYFGALARQVSQGPSSIQGGDIGWCVKGQMDPTIESAVLSLKLGEFTRPIRTNAGYKIVMLKDLKPANESALGQTQMTYKQIVIPFQNLSEADYQIIEDNINDIQQSNSCHDFEQKAQRWGYQCETYSGVLLGALPIPLQHLLRSGKIGECIKPIRTEDHLIVIMVCNRSVPSIRLPSAEEVRERIGQEKLNRCAARELAKLCSIASIINKMKN